MKTTTARFGGVTARWQCAAARFREASVKGRGNGVTLAEFLDDTVAQGESRDCAEPGGNATDILLVAENAIAKDGAQPATD